MSRKIQYYVASAIIVLSLCWAKNTVAIQITEIMYSPKDDNPSGEFIELYNETISRRDISGWRFTSGIDYIFPDGSVIEPRSYLVVAHNPKGLKRIHNIETPVFGPFSGALSDQKGRVTLVDLAGGVMADVAYKSGGNWPIAPEIKGHSLSKIRPRLNPDNSDNWRASLQIGGTPGRDNGLEEVAQSPSPVVILSGDVVINEIMYHPPSDSDDDEYIELYNRGKAPVDLSNWSISGGISFHFPPETIISSDSYLVIAKAKTHLVSRYSLNPDLVLGDFTGRLSNDEEAIRLRDSSGNKIDEVHYYDGGRWHKDADGYGPSLELIDPNHDNGNHQAWMASDEAKNAKWTQIIYSGVLGGGWPSGSEFHCHLLDAGEMLIDNIRLTSPKKTSLLGRKGGDHIENGSFENGLQGWSALGTHIQSRVVDTESKDGAKCLRIVASGTGNTGPNHLETPLRTSLERNETYTISFWAKWQSGNNLLVTRCLGNQIAETHRIPIPKLTGTPGKQNSVYKPNIGPVFRNVSHSPVIPTGKDTVYVTAHVYDPDGIGSVTLHYKPDRSADYQQTEMYDDGKHGDGTANDGIYGGEIPPTRSHQTVAFVIKATDKGKQTGTWPRNLEAPALYRIVNKPLESKLPTYRIITTARDTQELKNRVSLSNEPLNATFIFNEKDIYYQVGCRYTGSPHRRGQGRYSGYKVSFNADEKLHGVKLQARFDRNDNAPGGHYNERIAYDLMRKMGVPTCEQEWVYVRFNGRQSNLVWEHILPPGKRYLSIFYPDDSDGHLYEVIEQFTFHGRPEENGNFQSRGASFSWLGTGDKDLYRWYYLPRSRKRDDDYSNLTELVKVMSKTPDRKYKAAMEQIINVDEWLKVIAVRVIVSDWDFLGSNTGKNSYIYRPGNSGKWELLSWDNEWGFQDTRMSIWAHTPSVRRLQEKYQHLYFSYIHEILQKYFNQAYLMPWFEHYHSVTGGANPRQMASFVRERGNYLNGIIPKAKIGITQKSRINDSTIELEGTAPVQTRMVMIAGNKVKPDWIDATRWKLTISDVKENITLEFLDYDNKVIGKASVSP